MLYNAKMSSSNTEALEPEEKLVGEYRLVYKEKATVSNVCVVLL